MTADQVRRHHRRHVGWPADDCPRCLINRARCLFKQRHTIAEADGRATATNEANGYSVPVVPYCCMWCDQWHITSRLNAHRRRRVQGAYRKWATRRELVRRQQTGVTP